MNSLINTLQQALGALEYHTAQTRPIERTTLAIAALREAISAAPQPHAAQHGEALEPGETVGAAQSATAPVVPAGPLPEGFVIAPHFPGFANLGIGAYLLNHSAAGEPAELIVSIATEAEKAGRVIGDERENPDGHEIQPEVMAVRLRFANVAGLDALEQRLRYLRAEHFPGTEPAGGEVFYGGARGGGKAVVPVAYRYKGSRGHWRYVGYPFTPGWDMPQWLKHEPLYPAPPAHQAVPLTDADIRRLMLEHGFTIKEGLADLKPYVYEAARAIERAHGIGGKEPTNG